ncbi:sarcosine oxidase subunit alpha family protein [Sulfitobacter sp. JB4-11]|uniref:sarcosine oxidase subunit alpha family protein n=1 Tax=Sulfitobacter rhodophyticola TaxID=3238304 RepID=UPI003D81775C
MRISGKGLVDRSQPVTFTFDGVPVKGFVGDTVASALLAKGQVLMGRSFKYHRPRGVLTAGSEEPNALITVGKGAAQVPNVRATQQEIYDGLVCRSQNAWPSLSFDVMAVNDLAAPFLGAGFYYKTFMWPKSFWEWVYEPVIRKAAGLGALSGKSNTQTYDKAFAFCDLLVVGAGPSGLMAAWAAAQSGVEVIVADEDALPGGRLNAETEAVGHEAGHVWAAQLAEKLRQMDNVRIMPRTTVTGVYDGNVYGALERLDAQAPSGAPVECFWRITARQAVLAAGALERPIAFQNNDRPGIMMASAVRAFLNRWGVCPGKHVTVFGNNDDAHRTARDLAAAGVHIAALIDSREGVTVEGVDFPVYTGAQVCNASGRSALESITVRTAFGEEAIQTDCLAISGGWNPTVHLTCHMNGRPTWNADVQSFVPTPGAVPDLIPAGACNGEFSTAACLEDGLRAAKEALKVLGKRVATIEVPKADDAAYALEPLWAVAGKGRAWLDFQNDVTVKDVKQAAVENFQSVEHMKRYTTQGMATDQGKSSNMGALAILADATGRAIPETGTTTYRPPFVPVSIAAIGAGAQGVGFAPQRFATSHKQSVAMGAPMIEAGMWYRPSYFPKPHESTWRHSCDREIGYVRQAVGICDVSTLGKIDIQGPDAAKLLDFVYSNTFSTLKVGKVRYGLMLREDGHVMDDGTCARLGDRHYLMTTTTAAAGQVMRHLEFVCQVLHPEWQVAFTSVTEHWAQYAVAGPRARELLNDILDQPIDNETWPFMSCGAVGVQGVKGRLFRISFSGEQGYEVAVPARYGASLFDLLVKKADALGGGAYGMEALNVLRIEKGFITHAEIHGRVTAFDIGMARMVSAKKDCIGQTMAARPGLVEDTRAQLVGLKPAESGKLTAGAHLYDADAEPTRVNHQGYVTSVGYSPSMGCDIGLGFVKGGPARMGEVIRLVDALRKIETAVEICSPVFVDPEGERLRG